jgi:hypothetical protein
MIMMNVDAMQLIGVSISAVVVILIFIFIVFKPDLIISWLKLDKNLMKIE